MRCLREAGLGVVLVGGDAALEMPDGLALREVLDKQLKERPAERRKAKPTAADDADAAQQGHQLRELSQSQSDIALRKALELQDGPAVLLEDRQEGVVRYCGHCFIFLSEFYLHV